MEILVVVSVIAVISSFAISYGKLGQRQIALYIEEQKIAEMIFRAKSLAVATYQNPDKPKSCGYGLEINYQGGAYSMFSYVPSTQPPDCSAITRIQSDYRVEITSSKIGQGIVLKNDSQDSMYAVLFVPPAPRTLISNSIEGDLSSAPAKIYLETIDGSARADITVNLAGQIDF